MTWQRLAIFTTRTWDDAMRFALTDIDKHPHHRARVRKVNGWWTTELTFKLRFA